MNLIVYLCRKFFIMNSLKIVIEENGWSQKEFADLCGIASGTINKIANQRMTNVSNRLKNKILIAINGASKKGLYQLEHIFPVIL